MAVMEVRQLSLSRGGSPVLHDISLAIEKGEVFMMIGPSGSGKSSLLRCLNRLEEPPPGSVFLNGTDITTRPVTEVRCRVGMVFQQVAMFPGTVAENVAFGPTVRGETLPPERVRELLDMVTLSPDLAEKSARELSGGQAQRVAIARALANEPAVLLLDEPTSALDPIATHAVEETLLGLRERIGLTLVWVSHIVEQARRVGDRVLLLDGGRVVRVDRAEAMLDPEQGDERVLAFANGDESGMQMRGRQTEEDDRGHAE